MAKLACGIRVDAAGGVRGVGLHTDHKTGGRGEAGSKSLWQGAMGLHTEVQSLCVFFFFQAEDGIRDLYVTGVQTCALPILAHELVHVVQQAPVSGAPARTLARQPAPAAPAYGPACGSPDPCQKARCTPGQITTVTGDLNRAVGYVGAAIAALQASPLAETTLRALDWYFTSHTQATADAVRTELECIRWSLNDTLAVDRWGCHPEYDANAYTCATGAGTCSHHSSPVCLTDKHFGNGPRKRAETVIHECAHKEGMSVGMPQSGPDIYQWHTRFRNLDTAEALLNADSFALFATAVTEGVPLSGGLTFGASGGLATAGAGRTTWFARLYLGTDLQHPRLSVFNPTLGLGMTLIGQPATPGAVA